jgi:glycerophosphoryl diester phosphodiesterase
MMRNSTAPVRNACRHVMAYRTLVVRDSTANHMSVQIVASECCAARYPQNTAAGFAYCLRQSFDGIEFDVHLSADGHVVVHHDYRLNPRIARVRSGMWIETPAPTICGSTLAELQTYDVGRYRAGSPETEAYPDYRPLDGEPIPSLDQLLRAYAEQKGTATLWIEIKTSPYQRSISSQPNALVRQIVEDVTSAGVQRHTVLLAFEWDTLCFARSLSHEIETDFLTLNHASVAALNRKTGPVDPYALYGEFDPRCFSNSIPRAIKAAGGDWWGPYVHDVDAADVAEAHQLGLRVNLWNVDSNDAAVSHALSLGADAITLSDPDLLVRKLIGHLRT